MRVTLLIDNLASNGLRAEHGLSFLIETDLGAVLFDTGQTDSWFDNLVALGLSSEAIEAIAISHGHYDHTGGLARAVREAPRARCFAHPGCFEPKYSQTGENKRYIGMPDDGLSLSGAFTLNTSPVEVVPGVVLSGPIPIKVEVESTGDRFRTGYGSLVRDTFEDEQCIAIRHGDSAVVLVGCAHRGLENNVIAAMDAVGVKRVDLLAGGFHLGGASDSRLEAMAGFLNDLHVEQVVCCHCTGTEAYEYLRPRLGAKVTQACAGVAWDVPDGS